MFKPFAWMVATMDEAKPIAVASGVAIGAEPSHIFGEAMVSVHERVALGVIPRGKFAVRVFNMKISSSSGLVLPGSVPNAGNEIILEPVAEASFDLTEEGQEQENLSTE